MILVEIGNRLLKFQPASGSFTNVVPREFGERFKALGTLNDGRVCVQCFAAAYGTAPHLELFDGERFEPLLQAAPEGCGPEFTAFYAVRNGDLWLSGDLATALWHSGKWRVFASIDRGTPVAAVGFAEAADGRLWCATPDAIWAFDGRTWLQARGGFDRVSGLARTRDGSLWVAANSGLYRLIATQGAWIENGREEGLSSASVRALLEDPSGRLWAGTTRGLSFYDPDVNRDPPLTRIRIHEMSDVGKRIPEGGTITFRFDGQDKWKYTPYTRLLYTYQLDDHEWTQFSEANSVAFSDQPSGTHVLRVRAMDRNGNVETKPSTYEFEVILPWYRETRLVLISGAGLAGALFFAGLAFNRHLRLVRSYAEVEKKVAERTRELELANRELLHSQKMTALGTLAAGIAHDFNNILSIIQGSAQIIEDNLDNPAKVRTRVERIKTVVDQGAGIVKAMLGFSRDSGPQPVRATSTPSSSDTVKLLGDRFLREVQVTFDLRARTCPRSSLSRRTSCSRSCSTSSSTRPNPWTSRKQVTLATRTLDRLPDTWCWRPAGGARLCGGRRCRISAAAFRPKTWPASSIPFSPPRRCRPGAAPAWASPWFMRSAKKMEAGLAVESVVGPGQHFHSDRPRAGRGPNPKLQPH